MRARAELPNRRRGRPRSDPRTHRGRRRRVRVARQRARHHCCATSALCRCGPGLLGIHFDVDYARRRGFDGVIVHGLLKAAFLAELGQDWAGEGAWYRSFGARYTGTDLVGAPIVCRGRVASLDPTGGQIGLELWTENVEGQHHHHGNRNHPDRRIGVSQPTAVPTARFSGEPVLITGGAGGMGAAMARRFASSGARVAIVDLKPDAVADTSDRLRQRGP